MPPGNLPRLPVPEWLEFSVELGKYVFKEASALGIPTPLAGLAAGFAGFVGAAAYAEFPGLGLEITAQRRKPKPGSEKSCARKRSARRCSANYCWRSARTRPIR